jgi:heme/copper-type cytochrome/quinol oxidase subunit 2
MFLFFATTKTAKQKNKNFKSNKKNIFSKEVIIGIVIAAAVISIIAYIGINSLIPVNGRSPVFSPPRNSFIKAVYSPQTGFIFVSQSSGAVRGLRGGGMSGSGTDQTYTLKKGSIESIHIINEDYQTHSKHNFNIDEFNVHTKDLGYFQTQTVTFIADKEGTFQYYCTIHPEMKGTILVQAE